MESTIQTPRPSYDCFPAIGQPDLEWDGTFWREHESLPIAHFHPQGSAHKPPTSAKLAYDDTHIHVLFSVQDRYVRSIRTAYQDAVYKDSCVEFFMQPIPGRPYINFEVNCGGALLMMHNIPEPGDAPSKVRECIPADLAGDVRIKTTAPKVVDPEVIEPYAWRLLLSVPVRTLEHYLGPLHPLAGKSWRMNLYKCADESSHPHWGSWSPVQGELSFHRVACFGVLNFRAKSEHDGR